MSRLPGLVSLAVALVLALVACGGDGGGDDPASVLAETEANLAELESGELSLRLVAAGTGDSAEEVGIELTGPFAFGAEGELPVAEIEYTETAGEASAGGTFISTGDAAFIEIGDTAYELPPEAVDRLRGEDENGGLERLAIEDWLVEPQLSEGPEATDQVEGRLDVVEAANDIAALLRDVGAGDVGPFDGDTAEALERSARSSRVVVLTGAEDRLLRRLTIELELGVEGGAELQQALELLGGGANLTFDLRIERPNEPVGDVAAPEDAVPFPG